MNKLQKEDEEALEYIDMLISSYANEQNNKLTKDARILKTEIIKVLTRNGWVRVNKDE